MQLYIRLLLWYIWTLLEQWSCGIEIQSIHPAALRVISYLDVYPIFVAYANSSEEQLILKLHDKNDLKSTLGKMYLTF